MSTKNFELLNTILNSHSRVSKKIEQTLGSLHGLGLSEYLVLKHLANDHVAISRINLAELIGLTASGVTRLLNPMEKIGLIKREINERDARLSLVKISGVGLTKFKDSSVSVEEVLNTIFSDISEDEKNTFVSIMKRVY